MVTLDPDIVQRIHHILCLDADVERADNNDSASGTPLCEQFTADTLGFFLEMCHLKIPTAEFHQDIIKDLIIKEVLPVVKVYQNHMAAIPSSSFVSWTASRKSEGVDSVAADLHVTLSAMREAVKAMEISANRSTQTLIEQHGAVLNHGSLEVLMGRMGNAVDVDAMRSYCEQLGAIHAAQHAVDSLKAVELFHQLETSLENILKEWAKDNGGVVDYLIGQSGTERGLSKTTHMYYSW